jgi:hypothetical protein
MSTIEILNAHAELLIFRLKAGEKLNKEERKVLEIYNRLHGGKAINGGKRKRNISDPNNPSK